MKCIGPNEDDCVMCKYESYLDVIPFNLFLSRELAYLRQSVLVKTEFMKDSNNIPK